MGSTMATPQYGLYDYQRQVMLDTIDGIEQLRGVMDPYPTEFCCIFRLVQGRLALPHTSLVNC